jgi:hypothetical protein
MYWDKIVPQCKNMGWLALGLVSLVIVIMMILFLFLWLVGLVLGLLGGASKSGMTSPDKRDKLHFLERWLPCHFYAINEKRKKIIEITDQN